MASIYMLPELEHSASVILGTALAHDRRMLLLGDVGVGKSTLAASLARVLWQAGRRAWCIDADPGMPSFGIPGAVCRGEWWGEGWRALDLEALCSLDAGRFRLPLVASVRRLAENQSPGVLLVDAPGVVRGVAGAELFTGLVEAARIDLILVLARSGSPPLLAELKAGGVETFLVQASPTACRSNKRQWARGRTSLWDDYLHNAEEWQILLAEVELIGTPPPCELDSAWTGRQVALLSGTHTLGLGEVMAKDADRLRLRMPPVQRKPDSLLVRDAQRGEDGVLTTAKAFGSATLRYIPPPDVKPYPSGVGAGGPCPVAQVGTATVVLVNGIFGDPLLHVRLRQQRRSLLFDLGEGSRLPARIAHQVSDVFISHAHIDHIAGFLWLLRSRLGDLPACRVFGPPGLSENIAGLLNGILWDRIGESGPRFEVTEFHQGRLLRFALRAGRHGVEQLAEQFPAGGLLIEEAAFTVRAVTLDHGTPVLAFAFEQPRQFHIRKERLAARSLAVGPWLSELKSSLARGELEAPVQLADGSVEAAGVLGHELVLITPGQKLAYATDLADTAENRRRLTALARGAHTFFCEASFIEADRAQAERTGHLTARACGEIATAAAVTHLIPFHFSRRYEGEPERVYQEVRAACSRLVAPKEAAGFCA